MGMFDYVNVAAIPCSKCGRPLSGFQSKDGDCMLDVIDPQFVASFYTICDHCGEFVTYARIELPDKGGHRGRPYTFNEITALGFKLAKKGVA